MNTPTVFLSIVSQRWMFPVEIVFVFFCGMCLAMCEPKKGWDASCFHVHASGIMGYRRTLKFNPLSSSLDTSKQYVLHV